ncbi:trypsin-7-like [Ctenocephalides felis]|uniref:trypsin-7-like n=1 Tax=Ctenocephalides felis TaxID=7515 RepID=UPI000E6E2499|nr:trypsin-7-like [Ctenocephalides felis]
MNCGLLFVIFSYIILLDSGASCDKQPIDRIVGGANVSIEDYGWQVSVQLLNLHYCGETIIAKQWVLTAAHCFISLMPIRLYSVRAGSDTINEGGIVKQVEKGINHPKFNDTNYDNDVSLLYLETPLHLNGITIRTISLIEPGVIVPQGEIVRITGWGYTKDQAQTNSKFLKGVSIPILDPTECKSRYGRMFTNNMLCAGYLEGEKDACQGDDGGPLITKNRIVIGITSWASGCGRKDSPDNDAAVVRLSSPLSVNSGSIRPIKLVNSGVELRGGTKVTVSGWGRLTESPSELSPTLQGATITVIDNPTCQRYYVADYVITDNMMCAGFIEGGKGPCQGDTGGPLVEGNKTLVGIISWALGCARPASPGVYTRLASTSVRNFIRSVTGL